MTSVRLELPPKLIPVFTGPARYRGAYGGRGSGKTRGFAKMLAVRAYMFAEANTSGVMLCGREFMNSLSDSSMEEIKQAIRSEPWLDAYFDLGESYIRTKNKRVWFVFTGLRTNLDSVKSKARILIAWIDEAEGVSETAWQKLLPTVRENDSEVWLTWNREVDGSATDERFLKNPPQNAKIVELNHSDNPWFPEVLEQERQQDQNRLDGATYAWIWEGQYRTNSDAQVFCDKYQVEEFEVDPGWDGPYDGLDFGFSQDPTAAVRVYIGGDTLYVAHEAGRTGLELDETANFICERIPGYEKGTPRADNARPESISYLKKPDPDGRRMHLPNIKAVEKGKGSVEDGVQFIKSFRIVVIHPRCKEVAKEFRMYSYKVDRLTGDIKTEIVDKWNHYIDAMRYALEPIMKSRGRGFFG